MNEQGAPWADYRQRRRLRLLPEGVEACAYIRTIALKLGKPGFKLSDLGQDLVRRFPASRLCRSRSGYREAELLAVAYR